MAVCEILPKRRVFHSCVNALWYYYNINRRKMERFFSNLLWKTEIVRYAQIEVLTLCIPTNRKNFLKKCNISGCSIVSIVKGFLAAWRTPPYRKWKGVSFLSWDVSVFQAARQRDGSQLPAVPPGNRTGSKGCAAPAAQRPGGNRRWKGNTDEMECAVCGDAAQKGTAVQFHQCFRTTGECIGISYFSISSGMCFHRCFVETHSDLTVRISALGRCLAAAVKRHPADSILLLFAFYTYFIYVYAVW